MSELIGQFSLEVLKEISLLEDLRLKRLPSGQER